MATAREILDRDHVIVVGLLRQLVEAVGELPARTVTLPVLEARTAAWEYLRARDAYHGVDQDGE